MKKSFLSFAWLLIMIGIYSCTYNKVDPMCNKALPDSAKFNQHILPILVTNCSIPDCHSGTTPKGNLNLESSSAYNVLLDRRKGYVDTLDPKGSLLYSSLISESDPMPPSGQLSDCDLKMILKWMEQKAKNN